MLLSSPTTRALVFGSLSSLFLLASSATLFTALWPAVVALSDVTTYQPHLPRSEDRDEPLAAHVADAAAPVPLPSLATVRSLYPPLLTDDVPAITDTNAIQIPSIGVSVPLVLSASMNDADVLATLDRGASLYPNGVLPGHLGNVFVAAHSTGEPWKGKYRFAFLKINQLEPGNLIHLDWNSTRYTYRISDSEIVVPEPGYRITSTRPVPTITLMACWPLWSTSKRMLVHGELVNITQLTEAPS